MINHAPFWGVIVICSIERLLRSVPITTNSSLVDYLTFYNNLFEIQTSINILTS